MNKVQKQIEDLEQLVRELKYTEKQHENDRLSTFGLNIPLMCSDIAGKIESTIDILKEYAKEND